MNRHLYLIILGLLFFINPLLSQDFIFSQYFASQPYLNPAMTGFFDGSYRVNAHYRNQWATVGSGINTYGVNADVKLMENQMDGDYIGLGVNAYRDDNGYTANTISKINASYTKKFGYNVDQFLSIGTNFGLNHDGLSTSGLIYPDQISEDFQRKSIANFDLGLGVNYQVVFPNFANFFVGGSLDHIVSMKNSYFNNNESREKRYNIYSSARFKTSEIFYVLPTLLYVKQGIHSQINGGLMGQYLFNSYPETKSTISAGIYARFGNNAMDALIGMVRYEYKGIQVGLSYDHNMNELNTVTKGLGAFELSLGFIGVIEKHFQSRANCPNIKSF